VQRFFSPFFYAAALVRYPDTALPPLKTYGVGFQAPKQKLLQVSA